MAWVCATACSSLFSPFLPLFARPKSLPQRQQEERRDCTLHCWYHIILKSDGMSCSFRALERLPPEIFENLATNDEEGQENDKDKGMQTTSSLSLSFCPSIVLQQRLCRKLKSFSHKKIGNTSHRTKQKCIRNVGEFLKICETDLVRALDPLLTFGKILESSKFLFSFSTCTVY